MAGSSRSGSGRDRSAEADVGAREIIPLAQQRHVQLARTGVCKTIPKVQAGRMVPLAVTAKGLDCQRGRFTVNASCRGLALAIRARPAAASKNALSAGWPLVA